MVNNIYIYMYISVIKKQEMIFVNVVGYIMCYLNVVYAEQ